MGPVTPRPACAPGPASYHLVCVLDLHPLHQRGLLGPQQQDAALEEVAVGKPPVVLQVVLHRQLLALLLAEVQLEFLRES